MTGVPSLAGRNTVAVAPTGTRTRSLNLPAFPAPFADDLAAHRIVTRLDPFQVADRLRPDDDLVKAHRVRRGVDARRAPCRTTR